ncbi:MAG: hypothetical protein WB682_10600 [Candidatus Dormiibacterota bacterium]|jgi:hypothetical protein
MSMKISPDGMYYWDGQQWLSTLSLDGRNRWNGEAWVPTGPPSPAMSYQQPQPSVRQPTSWTRPLQLTVAAWYGLSALYALSLPFWMAGPMTQAVKQSINQSIQRQQQLNPTVSPPPPGLADTISSMIGGITWVAAIFGVAICLVVIIGALNRWTWLYYVLLVFLGLSAISLPINLVSAAGGSALSGASGFSMPAWTYWLGLVTSIPSAALFVWMLIALVRRGPWGMTRVKPAVS